MTAYTKPSKDLAEDGVASKSLQEGRRGFLYGQMNRLLLVLLFVVVFTMAIVPLIYMVNSSLYGESDVGLTTQRSLAAVLDVYASGQYYSFLGSAMLLSSGVTTLSLSVGVIMALLMARTVLPAKGLLDFLIIMPLFISPFTGMIAWVALGSAKTGFVNVLLQAILGMIGIHTAPAVNVWSVAGVVWVMFLFFCPFGYLFTVGNLRSMDASLEEAARAHGASPVQALWRVTLPMISPAIIAAGLLIFLLSAEMYTIPEILGSPVGFTTLPTRIYEDSMLPPVRQAHAAAAGTMLLIVTILGVWLQRASVRKAERFVTMSGKGFNGRLQHLGCWRWTALAFIATYVLLADVLPFGALLLSSLMKYSAPTINLSILTLRHYSDIFTLPSIQKALINTVVLALISSTVCVLIGLVISFMELRRGSYATQLLAFIGVIPVAVPGLVYGIGLIWALVRTPFYGTIWALLLAYVAKFLPYGIVISRTGLLQIQPELEQCARTSGASAMTTLRRITMPLIQPTLIAVFFFLMLQSIKELSASVLLSSQDSVVLSVLAWNYMDAGDYQSAAALGMVQTLLMMGLVIASRLVFSIKLEKTLSRQ